MYLLTWRSPPPPKKKKRQKETNLICFCITIHLGESDKKKICFVKNITATTETFLLFKWKFTLVAEPAANNHEVMWSQCFQFSIKCLSTAALRLAVLYQTGLRVARPSPSDTKTSNLSSVWLLLTSLTNLPSAGNNQGTGLANCQNGDSRTHWQSETYFKPMGKHDLLLTKAVNLWM